MLVCSVNPNTEMFSFCLIDWPLLSFYFFVFFIKKKEFFFPFLLIANQLPTQITERRSSSVSFSFCYDDQYDIHIEKETTKEDTEFFCQEK